jgi:hypothetical protein
MVMIKFFQKLMKDQVTESLEIRNLNIYKAVTPVYDN